MYHEIVNVYFGLYVATNTHASVPEHFSKGVGKEWMCLIRLIPKTFQIVKMQPIRYNTHKINNCNATVSTQETQ